MQKRSKLSKPDSNWKPPAAPCKITFNQNSLPDDCTGCKVEWAQTSIHPKKIEIIKSNLDIVYCNHREAGLLSEVCGLCSHVRFVFTLFKVKVGANFPTKKHNRSLDSAFHSLLNVCVCVCSSVSVPSLTHMYALVAKQTQVFGVLLRSQALYSHQFNSDCTGVTDHCTHEWR